MNFSKFLCFLPLLISVSFAQTNFNGIWQGIIQKEGSKLSESSILFAEFTLVEKNITGKTRDELPKSDNYIIHRIKGQLVDSITIKFKQYISEAKKLNARTTWMYFKI